MTMSRFRLAANLAFLYTERPLLERFAAARSSGSIKFYLSIFRNLIN